MRFEMEEVKDIEITITVKVNGKEIKLTDDEVSALVEQLFQPTVSYSVKPVFVRLPEA